jgi:hypothetical protein
VVSPLWPSRIRLTFSGENAMPQRKRTITIELPSMTDEDYADLAHAAWMLVKVAGLADRSIVWADTADTNDTLTARWRSYETEAPWRYRR